MSIEYFAPVEVVPTLPAVVREELAQTDDYEVLSCSETITLRLLTQPAREHWPEDVEIHFKDGVHVVFHSANRLDRRRLLDRLQSVLARLGHSATFSED
jgi:hypothetical protein